MLQRFLPIALAAALLPTGGLTAQEAVPFPFPDPGPFTAGLDVHMGRTEPVNDRLLSVNIDWPDDHFSPNKYATPGVAGFMRTFDPVSVRWPQGVWANFYDWRTDKRIVKDDGYNNKPFDKQASQAIRYGYEAFRELHDELGFDVLFTFSLNYDSPADAVARYRDRRNSGFPLTHIELGNEQFWRSQRSAEIKNEALYVERAKAFSRRLKALDPDLKVSVPLSWQRGGPGFIADHTKYNQALIEDPTYFDAVTVHRYVHAGRGKETTPEDYRTILTSPLSIQDAVDFARRGVEDKEVWLTEWGVSCGQKAASYLGMADAYLYLFDNQDLYQYANWFHIAAYNPFFKLDIDKNKEVVAQKYGFGSVYEVLRGVFEGGTLIDGTVTAPALEGTSLAVVARATRKADGELRVIAVNKTDRPVPFGLSFDGVAYAGPSEHGAMTFSHLGEDVGLVPWDDAPLKPVASEGEGLTLPPYSINVFSGLNPG